MYVDNHDVSLTLYFTAIGSCALASHQNSLEDIKNNFMAIK